MERGATSLASVVLIWFALVLISRLIGPSPLILLDPFRTLIAADETLANHLKDNSSEFSPHDITTVARQAPLWPRPYFSLLNESEPSNERRKDYFLHALKLSPRSAYPRILEAESHIEQKNFDVAAEHLIDLMDLDPDQREIWRDTLISMSNDPDVRDRLVEALKQKPRWGAYVARHWVEFTTDTATAQELTNLYPEYHSNYLMRLVSAGAIEYAWLSYLSSLSANEIDSAPLLRDGYFKGSDAPLPFNWAINSKHANLEPGGGLYISFYGQNRPRMLRQLISLPPGDYLVRFRIRGSLPPESGYFHWVISCSNFAQPIAELDIKSLETEWRELLMPVTVPNADCAFQNLDLYGIAGSFPRTSRLSLNSVSISQASR